MTFLKYGGYFLIFFVVTYVGYYFFVTNGQIKSVRGKSKKKKELSAELILLKKKYNVDIEKIGIIKVLKIVNFVNALFISTLVLAIIPVKQMWLKFVIILVVLVPLIWVVYYFLAKYLKHLERKIDNV